MLIGKVVPACLLLGMVVVQPAAAATTVLITYTGTVSSGTDATGVFGAPGHDLTGSTFTTVYTLTYPTAGALEVTNPNDHYVYGGTYTGSQSPMSAELTINGATQNFSGESWSMHYLETSSFGYPGISDVAYGPTQMTFVQNRANMTEADNSASSLNLIDTASYTLQPYDSSGYFRLGYMDESVSFKTTASGSLISTAISIQPVSAVPEPATWLMMILGFCGVGITLRMARGRNGALTAAAATANVPTSPSARRSHCHWTN